MMRNGFGSAAKVNITILVDNRADLIVKSSDQVKYFADKPLLAEHGFSALLHVIGEFPGEDLKILWDAGGSGVALIENLNRMEIDPKSIDKIVLSHGHYDHYAALTEFLAALNLGVEPKEWADPVTSAEINAWLDAKRIPVIAHPAAFRERWWLKDNGNREGPLAGPPRLAWEAYGAAMELREKPYQLAPGCWTTGTVPRISFEQSGRPTRLLFRQGESFYPDDLEDDQAIVIHLETKGLVVISGCAHAGIVNTVHYAREISGVERIFAIIGGFHLARSNPEEIQATIQAIRALEPEILVPCHCTGFQAMCAFAGQMQDSFFPGVVGATYPL